MNSGSVNHPRNHHIKALTGILIIALMAGMLCTQIMPVSAEPDPSYSLSTTGSGTAELSTEQKHGGTYSVKLYCPGADSDYAAVEIPPPSGITIDDLDAITTGWSFWYYVVAGGYHGPLLELRFTGSGFDPATGAEHVDITVDTAELVFVTDTWTEETVTSSSHAIAFGNHPDGSAFANPAGDTLANLKTWLIGLDASYANWELTRVQVQIGWFYGLGSSTAYIDDITINGFTYGLEEGPSVSTTTGTGSASFTVDAGNIGDINAVNEATLPTAGKPYLRFPHGFFSFKITGIGNGDTVTVTITLPSNVPTDTEYWKYHTPEGWVDVTSLLGDNDGDNVLTLTLTDGGLGDDDGTANGEILDQGGPGSPWPPEVGGGVFLVDKLALLVPYIAAILVIVTGTVAIRKYRR